MALLADGVRLGLGDGLAAGSAAVTFSGLMGGMAEDGREVPADDDEHEANSFPLINSGL